MTYPYGTKGAPVVGNGLGGLPRRAVAGGAASSAETPFSTRATGYVATYSAQATLQYSYGSTPRMASSICFPDRIIQLYSYLDTGSTNRREVFVINLNADGSSASTSVGIITGQMDVDINNFCGWGSSPVAWHVVSNSKVIGISRQRVLILELGANGIPTSTVYIETPPSSGTFINGGTWSTPQNPLGRNQLRGAIVTQDNQIVTCWRDTSSNIGLFVYDFSGNFIKAVKLAAFISGTLSEGGAIFAASFGYVIPVAVSFTGSGSTYSQFYAITVNAELTSVISASSSYKWVTNNSGDQNATVICNGVFWDYETRSLAWLVTDQVYSQYIADEFSATGQKLDTANTTINVAGDLTTLSNQTEWLLAYRFAGLATNDSVVNMFDFTSADSFRPAPIIVRPSSKVSGSTLVDRDVVLRNRFTVKVSKGGTRKYKCVVKAVDDLMAFISNDSTNAPLAAATSSPDYSIVASPMNAPISFNTYRVYWAKLTTN